MPFQWLTGFLESRSNFKTLPFSATLCQSFSFTYSIGFMRFDLESEKNGRSIVSFWSRKVGPDRHSGDRRGTPVGCETAPKGTHPGLRLSEAQFAIEGAALRLSEGNTHSYRRFFLDGRTQKAALDVEPETYTGISVGKWDGEALVVDTVGFNDKTWLDPTGKPHSEAMHLTERYTRPDLGHLNVQITIEDEKALTKPYTFNRVFTLAPGCELQEYVCQAILDGVE